MTGSIRAFIFIVISIAAIHVLFGRYFERIIEKKYYQRLMRTYILILFFAAVSPSYWYFIICASFIIIFTKTNDAFEKIGLFLFLLLALPNFSQSIPGIAGIRYIFDLSYARFLILILLLPLLLERKSIPSSSIGFISTDKFISLYIFLVGILGFRNNSFTNASREIFMLFIDIFLPYYVLSRHITNIIHLKKLLAIFILSVCILSLISLLEITKTWHIYAEFTKHLHTQNHPPLYLIRSGMLRASAVFFTPIGFGLTSTMAIGAFLYLRSSFEPKFIRLGISTILILGLISSLSRGPWLGFAVLLIVYTYLQNDAIQKTVKYLVYLIFLVPLLSLMPFWDKIISLLPFIGNVETENITYRQRLIDNSLLVIEKYPFFGSTTYLNEPEMQRMIQGQGIVDLVNTYIWVALSSGIIGLILFVLIFTSLLVSTYQLLRTYQYHKYDEQQLVIALMATMISILFIISTVSFIDFIPYLCWIWTGLLAAYILIKKTAYKNQKQSGTNIDL